MASISLEKLSIGLYKPAIANAVRNINEKIVFLFIQIQYNKLYINVSVRDYSQVVIYINRKD